MIDLTLEQPRDVIGAGDGNIDAELFHDLGIFGIVDPGDGFGNMENLFCQLAGNQVVLVLAGDGNHRICLGGIGAGQRLDGGAVRIDGGDVQLVREILTGLFVFFDDKRLVAMLDEGLAEIEADLAAADHNDIHSAVPFWAD